MIRRFIYQQKPVYTQADTALFSKGDFTCIRLYLTKKGKPVALSEGNSAAHYKWRVQYGFSCVVFKTYEEAVRFCRERFYDLDGKPLNGGRARSTRASPAITTSGITRSSTLTIPAGTRSR